MPRCSETEFILEPSHLAPRYTLFHIPCQQRWTHRAYLRERKWNERNPENFIVTYTPSTPKSNSNFSTILVVRWITAVNYDLEEEEGTDTRHQSFPELLYSVKGGGDFYRAFYRQDITLIANDFVPLFSLLIIVVMFKGEEVNLSIRKRIGREQPVELNCKFWQGKFWRGEIWRAVGKVGKGW